MNAAHNSAAAIARVNDENPALPLRKCADCQHDLGDPAKALACPLFGLRRWTAELRCPEFVARQ